MSTRTATFQLAETPAGTIARVRRAFAGDKQNGWANQGWWRS